MKTSISILFTFFTLALSFSQEIIIDTEGTPPLFTDIQAGEEFLYLPGLNKTLYRATYDDPQNYSAVAEVEAFAEIWKSAYNKNENVIYLNAFDAQLFSINLDDSTPISPNTIGSPGVSNGMTIANNALIIAIENSLLAVNEVSGNTDIVYTEALGEIRNPEFVDGSYYFQVFQPPYNTIVKLNISESETTREVLYSFDDNSAVQSSTINDGFLYLGFESGRILKFNIDDINLPLTPEIIDFQNRPVLGLTMNDKNLYISVNHRFVYRLENATLNIKKLELSETLIYPNPFTDRINLKNDSQEFFEYELLDINGKLLNKDTTSSSIIMNDLSKGIYFLKVLTDNSVQIKKILKK